MHTNVYGVRFFFNKLHVCIFFFIRGVFQIFFSVFNFSIRQGLLVCIICNLEPLKLTILEKKIASGYFTPTFSAEFCTTDPSFLSLSMGNISSSFR